MPIACHGPAHPSAINAEILGLPRHGYRSPEKRRERYRRDRSPEDVSGDTRYTRLPNWRGTQAIRLRSRMVPRRGLEPPRLAAHGPEPCASTNSATWARCAADVSGQRGAVNALSAKNLAMIERCCGPVVQSPVSTWERQSEGVKTVILSQFGGDGRSHANCLVGRDERCRKVSRIACRLCAANHRAARKAKSPAGGRAFNMRRRHGAQAERISFDATVESAFSR